jgi:hypothetical protein
VCVRFMSFIMNQFKHDQIHSAINFVPQEVGAYVAAIRDYYCSIIAQICFVNGFSLCNWHGVLLLAY